MRRNSGKMWGWLLLAAGLASSAEDKHSVCPQAVVGASVPACVHIRAGSEGWMMVAKDPPPPVPGTTGPGRGAAGPRPGAAQEREDRPGTRPDREGCDLRAAAGHPGCPGRAV